MSEVNDVIAELIESFKNGEVWVFAGAGISVNSGLPVVNQMVPYVLGKLGVSNEDIKTYTASRFCFEEFMQILLEFSDLEDPSEFLNLFREGKPNPNHILLAKLVKRRSLKTIVTTNFDLLIESALEAEGLRRGKDYEVFHREEDFEHMDWGDSKPCVVKIHGSIEDREAMAITLQRVARKELSSQRREIIERVFSTGTHRNVLALGYSSSDVFDISPHIATLEGELKRVILVEHITRTQSPSVENLALREKKNPFRQFEGSQRLYYDTDRLVRTLWDSLLKGRRRRVPRGTTDWEIFVDYWGLEIGSTIFGTRQPRNPEIAGRLFYSVSEFKTAMKYLKQASSNYCKEEELNAVDVMLGNICLRLGDLDKAVISYFQPALERVKATGSESNLIALMTSVAAMFQEHGESGRAVSYYMRALSKTRKIGHEKEVVAILAGLANALSDSGEFGAAKGFLKPALGKADAIGDMRTKALILGYFGDCHAGLKEYEKAIGYYEQAIEADRHLGYKSAEGLHFANVGDACIKLGDHEKAIEHYQHALKIADATEDDEHKASVLTILGSIYCATGAYRAAIDKYKEALRTCGDENEKDRPEKAGASVKQRRLKHEERERLAHEERFSQLLEDLEDSGLEGTPEGTEALAEWARQEREILKESSAPLAFRERYPTLSIKMEADAWFGLGTCYMDLGEDRNAIDAYEKGKLSVSIAGDERRYYCLFIILGDLHGKLGEHEEAIRYFNQALEINRKLENRDAGDRDRELEVLSGLGSSHSSQGAHQEALDTYEEALKIARQISDKQKEAVLEGFYLINIGKALFDLHQYSKSIESSEQGLALLKPILGDNDQHIQMATKILQLAKTLRELELLANTEKI